MPSGFIGLEPPPNNEASLWPWLRNLWTRFNTVQQGKLNCITTVTLAASTTVTALSDPRISSDSMLSWSPRSSNGAGAMTNLYVSAKSNGAATFTHASAATTDRTYDIAIIG